MSGSVIVATHSAPSVSQVKVSFPLAYDLEIFDPQATWKKKVVYDFNAQQLLVPIFLGGKRVYDCPSLQEIQNYCREQVDKLWDEVKRFDNPHTYYVDLSDKLWNIQNDLLHGND